MSDTIEKTFIVSSPARLNLGNIRGSVEIRPGEDGSIHIAATKRPSGDVEGTHVEMTQSSDGTVNVATRFPDAPWSWLYGSFPCCVDYVVTAPRRCSLELKGVSNTVDARGFEGQVNVNSVSGDVSLAEITGPLRVHTVSGKVTGERIAGSIDLDTISGDISLQGSNLPSANTNSVSARVELETPLGSGPYAFKSVSGSVRLTVPPETRCTAEMHSVSGDVVTVFPVTSYSRGHGMNVVQMQGGGTLLSVHTVSGDLSFDTRGQVPVSAAAPQGGTVEQRRAVLESIERGEMTVDEGLSRLRG